VLTCPLSLVGLDELDMDTDEKEDEPIRFKMNQARDGDEEGVPVTFVNQRAEREWTRLFGVTAFNQIFNRIT
jgi:hypothetical protein